MWHEGDMGTDSEMHVGDICGKLQMILIRAFQWFDHAMFQ